jgi:hypothetical protein
MDGNELVRANNYFQDFTQMQQGHTVNKSSVATFRHATQQKENLLFPWKFCAN